jgi:maltose alpha-D-glucosyltransferase/alpha-amylase
LQFSLRGTPVLRYGEEIGMGEDLSLRGREAIRTPMQWSFLPNAGFSSAPPDRLVRPVISGGEYGYETVNVTAQRRDPNSLLAWFERMIRTLREAPETGSGSCRHVDVPCPPGVLAHRADGPTGTMLYLHNLGDQPAKVDMSSLAGEAEHPNDVLADREYAEPDGLDALELAGYGYRWIRMRRRA